ncbi:MAG: peptidylprolyl isomerase [Desulfuromonadales bacterium]|nr:peptidylprolyl isomerase [Desulfuromonadales bacterium]
MNAKHIALRTQLALLAALFCFSSVASAAEDKPKETKPATAATAPAATKDEVVARVNGKPIYAAELQRAKKAYQNGQPKQEIPADKQKEFDQQALTQLVSAELLYQAGQKLMIKDLDKQVDEKISQGKKRFPTEQDFEKAIKALDMTESSLRDYTRRDIVISNYVQQNFASKITVSEEESKKFYDQNADKFKQPETVRASHILIGVDPKATDEDKKKAREKIESVRRALAGGSDFAKLAKENSTCPSSQQGGDLGYFGKGQMVPAFEQVAFSLKPGEISDVVETQFGYHIIKVMDKKDASTVPFKDAKPRIDDYLKGQKLTAAVTSYLDETRKTAKIETMLK